MRLVRPDGIVLWHDYGVWPSVTQAIEELEASRRLGLVNIRGTSLVFWRVGEDAELMSRRRQSSRHHPC